MTLITTPRLRLREWIEADRQPFAAMNRDPEVLRYLPGPLTNDQSDQLIERCMQSIGKYGFGWMAVESIEDGRFIGFVGLSHANFDAAFTPAVEIGWRLTRQSWGRGFATEAAKAALQDGFERAGLNEVVSYAAVNNYRSIAVMERIGMTPHPLKEFDHPKLSLDDPLCRHALYRISRP